jgi:NAD-dependent dihydropyrimidine dehydrogenase PreA subunit
MILNRNYYNKFSFWKSWWFKRQLLKLTGDKIFKSFKLHKTEWPDKIYFYSPRLKRKPLFIGDSKKLSLWKESKMCENICPTQAIEVTVDAIIIDDRGCIGCGICVEFAPAGLLEMSVDFSPLHRS